MSIDFTYFFILKSRSQLLVCSVPSGFNELGAALLGMESDFLLVLGGLFFLGLLVVSLGLLLAHFGLEELLVVLQLVSFGADHDKDGNDERHEKEHGNPL